jgi:hypothetical protein
MLQQALKPASVNTVADKLAEAVRVKAQADRKAGVKNGIRAIPNNLWGVYLESYGTDLLHYNIELQAHGTGLRVMEG